MTAREMISTTSSASPVLALLAVVATLLGAIALGITGHATAALVSAAAAGIAGVWVVARVRQLERDVALASRLRAVLDTTSDAIVAIDRGGRILDVNRRTLDVFGWTATELVGRDAGVLAAEPHATAHQSYVERFLATREARVVGRERLVDAKHRDGRTLPVAIRVSEIGGASGGAAFVGIIQDRRAQVERERLLEALTDVVGRLAAAMADLRSTASEQAASASEQAAAVAQTVATVTQVAQTSEQNAQRARQVAESSEEVEELARAGAESITSTLATVEAARAKAESVALTIADLAEQAQAIAELTGSVDDIAEQTNLLGLNAAIEAARAGEHGRGFSVVASEIKALSEQSKRATVQVRDLLARIQDATRRSVVATGEGASGLSTARSSVDGAGATIHKLTDLLEGASESAGHILASAGQQATGTAQIREALRAIDASVRRNLDGARQVERSAAALHGMSEKLQTLLSGRERGIET
ncbi:MAG: PAS domain S-box protein [Deltaproteobacteria bacterium]|nr:PAS domain S-box protein [Deltaproteobacteria bacterium]